MLQLKLKTSSLQQLSKWLQPKAAAIPTGDPEYKTGSWTSEALGHPQLPGWHRLLQGCPLVPLNLGGVGTVRCDCHVLLCLQDHCTLQEQDISLLLTHLQAILLNFALCQLSAENCLDTWTACKQEPQGKGRSPVTSNKALSRL